MTSEDKPESTSDKKTPQSRRDFLKGSGIAAGGLAAAATPGLAYGDTTQDGVQQPSNPYGKRPGGGISLPDYYRPTPSVANNNMFLPGVEVLPKNEMRISFVGSTPFPVTHSQAGTCIMVELGNGTPTPRRLFFDFGNSCLKNIIAMQVPPALVNDIFLTHLHVDHYADIPYLLPFSAWMGRWKPLRVTGPSGRTPELGTKAMIGHMKGMLAWHLENFDIFPIGDGYEVEVNEFDWKDENGICYDEDGVVVRHWRRSHGKDGASGYRLDWEDAGLSFVWTGDGRPDELTAKYSKGVDVFVTEGQMDTPSLTSIKMGLPSSATEYTIDTSHTPYYAAGYLMKEINPRLGMITHTEISGETIAEAVSEVRSHWPGLFIFGGPDVMVVNVTKEAIWSRMAILPDSSAVARPDPRALFGDPLPDEVSVPDPRIPREEQQEQETRDGEIDPAKYYPPDVARDLKQKWPPGMKIDIKKLLKDKKNQN